MIKIWWSWLWWYFVAFPEFIWHSILRKQLQKACTVALGCMSAAILLVEATLLPSGVDLSLFSILIKAVGKQEVLVQVRIWTLYVNTCNRFSTSPVYQKTLLLVRMTIPILSLFNTCYLGLAIPQQQSLLVPRKLG